ncbi:proto-oncogene Mas-like [Rhinatrema bivittatum]|uniref:proto-oncogene Mas-like n=1 Tax=Rhinatrema bivittatum TaxID=194408 RepID=UPI00112825C2|nr:proto-oncogene Mas-like [Rhinatrema bivittatum]
MPGVTPALAGLSTAPSNVTNADGFNVTDAGSIAVPRTEIIFGLSFLTLLIVFCGLLGNGIVIWFLGFRIPKNKFTVYILNLAVADFLFLISVWVLLVYLLFKHFGHPISAADKRNITTAMGLLSDFGFNAGIYLLMAVSFERCLCALYPIWYRCRRPTHQSGMVCALLWALSCLVTGLEQFICNGGEYKEPGSEPCTAVYLFTSTLFLAVIVLMILSSLTLIITIQQVSEQYYSSKLYIAIVASVVVFLVSVVPARLLGLLLYFKVLSSYFLMFYFFLVINFCSSVNCAANPFIYLLVGSLKKWRFGGSFLAVLQRVFKDESGTSGQERETTLNQTYLR